MDDLREKVISALQGEVDSAAYMGHSFKDCVPVRHLLDALSLLKAQKPRLLTEADFVNEDHYGYMPAWAEEKNGDQFWKIVRVASLGLEKKRLRYWTSRPTDEQREAVKWDE